MYTIELSHKEGILFFYCTKFYYSTAVLCIVNIVL